MSITPGTARPLHVSRKCVPTGEELAPDRLSVAERARIVHPGGRLSVPASFSLLPSPGARQVWGVAKTRKLSDVVVCVVVVVADSERT